MSTRRAPRAAAAFSTIAALTKGSFSPPITSLGQGMSPKRLPGLQLASMRSRTCIAVLTQRVGFGSLRGSSQEIREPMARAYPDVHAEDIQKPKKSPNKANLES